MTDAGCIRVEVIRAWPRRHQTITVTLSDAATVADALAASGMLHNESTPDGNACDRGMPEEIAGCAIFGERVCSGYRLHDGDRLELLRPLQIDPKQARRRRAQKQ
jgi:putative ubiquitin-RnfH superfamily antitoxin RatB of RatAB toxin-antitoxin module